MVAVATGIGLDATEKGSPESEVWKDLTPTTLFARARVTGTGFTLAAVQKNVQRNRTVAVRVRYESGDETSLELCFVGSADGAAWSKLPDDDAAVAGVSRVRPCVKSFFPADFANSAAGGANGTATPYDDGIVLLVSTCGLPYLGVLKKRTGGSDGGAGFMTIEAIGGMGV